MAGTDSSKSITYQDPIIILKGIQLPENLGMVMRTMLNFGFKNLRLVSPKIKWPNYKAIASSAGAYDIIGNSVKVFNSLEDATDDTHGYLVINSTSGSSTNAGENIDLEGATGITH